MDFTLALTHFCEHHGPKSVLCTQVLPLECTVCIAEPRLHPSASTDTLATRIHDNSDDDQHDYMTQSLHSTRTTGTTNTLPTNFSGASTNIDSDTDTPNIGLPKLHKPEDQSRGLDPQFKYGRAQGDTCASCALTIPQSVATQLPKGAPGSLKTDDKAKNTSPVLRSREIICLGHNGNGQKRKQTGGQSSSQESNGSSFASHTSTHSHVDCHDHTLTYLTTKSPDDPDNYAHLRASVIRTLSFEQLPKGMSDGRLCFGDDESGYTIAYVFRLTDPKARGRRRAYAFVALAGKNAGRAFKACPMLWEAFATMANRIELAAQRCQDAQEKIAAEAESPKNYTPITSFLTQRAVGPDGHVGRAGQTTPRSLADITGDENIFAILHQYFVAVLQCLGNHFGGLPLATESSAYTSLIRDEHNTRIRATAMDRKGRQVGVDSAAFPELSEDSIDKAKTKAVQQVLPNAQCGPRLDQTAIQGQVVV